MSEKVYMAMVSRGYDGDARTLHAARLHLVDAAWVACCLVVAVMALGIDRALF